MGTEIRYERQDGYAVTFTSYYGTSYRLQTDVSREDARRTVRSRLKRARGLGCPVVYLGKGEWEIQEPDNGVLVPPFCGWLKVVQATRPYRVILGRKHYLD